MRNYLNWIERRFCGGYSHELSSSILTYNYLNIWSGHDLNCTCTVGECSLNLTRILLGRPLRYWESYVTNHSYKKATLVDHSILLNKTRRSEEALISIYWFMFVHKHNLEGFRRLRCRSFQTHILFFRTTLYACAYVLLCPLYLGDKLIKRSCMPSRYSAQAYGKHNFTFCLQRFISYRHRNEW
jgi:hypothetical protein